jgi:molecular chaperone Hsp33
MDTSGKKKHAKEDRALRFMFEHTDIRGETVHLADSLKAILDIHQYAPGVERLIGEFLAAAVLLASTIKFKGKLVLQVRSEGQIPLLMVECTSEREVRAIARGAEQATSDSFSQLLHNGQLAITVDPDQGQRYQGIVPLAGDNLATSLEVYFEQSEQLHTRVWLAADEHCAAGLLLQQLPVQETPDPQERLEQWRHCSTLGATITADELLSLRGEEVLHRLFHEDPLRVFDPVAVEFRCSCSRQRTYNALASIGAAEVRDILDEQGSISMDCEFCNQQYVFLPGDVADLLSTDKQPTVH